MALPTDPRIRRNSRVDTSKLTPAEREALLKPYLPDPSTIRSARSRHGKKKQKQRRKPIRAFLKSTLHYLTYFLIHVVFSIYIRLRQGYHAIIDRILAILYYHHRTPELIQKDVRGLSQLPQHLSIVLMLGKDEDALDVIMDEVAELVAWSSCAGIPMLSIYEKTGILKSYIPTLHKIIISKLSTYYGPPSHQPTLRLFAPHHALYSPTLCPPSSKANPALFTLLLLSATDGRETLVDLTKTLTEMAQHGNLSPQDISPKLIDAEISELTSPPTPPLGSTPGDPLFDERNSIASSAGTGSSTAVSDSPRSLPADAATAVLMKSDPDLLMVFGPFVRLDGYPPWQLRLTEIYCTGDKGSLITGGGEAVEYQKFLKGLWRYARAEMRFGR
ncbi:conserved hypothetical protein [Histoplasma capsulatum G186AR]|uniref:ditrans,polycis-polyprenyl diphosphate synthase [(2E,6E)-farnesyldiphosphate specific] n=2 Tax=Ajellomyces capsulatus TaxID=5037 RepID=C0NKQ7_AJECG|nr:ditrans,polycis-polyprenyl diphosphate synthase [Histoplasma capsulatum G186AR]EEH08448.1 conserved hypothetical protein [Histoplasma capsulatum G186AR]KAG5299237.1 nuclear undecaprenyl pyrophosphate synthase [Histoplasma capsulatum]QSS68143.1 nuclear undecaprenyl pyrophosphate synthase [Histoplasma capsulatum G186AR]